VVSEVVAHRYLSSSRAGQSDLFEPEASFRSMPRPYRQRRRVTWTNSYSRASVAQQVIGLAAGIRVGSPAAINITIVKISELQSSPLFTLIEGSFHCYPQPASALPRLQQLMGLGVSGLDTAILPAMARLLDSGDRVGFGSTWWGQHRTNVGF
jgi:hypothetical protein